MADTPPWRQGIRRRRATVEELRLPAGRVGLVVEVVAEQEPTVAMFTGLGFEAEGLLKDHVRSQTGQVHDLLVLSYFVQALREPMATTGADDLVLDKASQPG